ncbi:Transcription factor 25 [Psilocybe cubensis]|uniref:Transcription factor 25 n=2 Tax=Psilocybe cubensis TaxID=181762 RepID=A0ACB8H6L9_PSICU|nr:Transcription factor 25 [Psilocybe cubensis]KAH9483302.1 Transcription factor 25 [Psilocybe cubensis]
MPPRLNKRQQRELEELEALKSVKPSDVQESSDEDLPGPSQGRSGGAFMNLLAPEDSEEEEEEKTTKSKKSKKKKKKAIATSTSDATPPTPTPPPPAAKTPRTSTPVPALKNEKKAQKKARAKEKKAANDELDQVLAELSIQYPPSQKISQSAAGKQSLADLLSVSLQHLDGEAEMRRFFGSRVVQASREEGQSAGRKKPPPVKSNLTRPQPSWWAAKGREGLSLHAYTDDETNAKLIRQNWTPMQEKWWTVEYSKKYKSMTKAFMDTVLSGDPQGFWDLLGTLPWHADTLLQVSEVYRHRDEHAQAVDFVDRALFTYERAFIGAFTFTTGLNRLDFDRVENRPFYLALHRQITDLQRRGCVRTAFEFSRLMYSLDPWNDPHGALLHLDFLATKAGMHQWLLDMFDVFVERQKQNAETENMRANPSLLPGWVYNRALALKIAEDAAKNPDHTESTLALREAARDFPSVVPLLADKLDISLPGEIRGHRDFKILTDSSSLPPAEGILHLLSHLYVQRSSPIWKDHAGWFESTIAEEFTHLSSGALPSTERRKAFLGQYTNRNLQFAVYRHIMVLETSYRRLFSFIPRQVLEAKSLACDPLPPPTAVSQYDEAFFGGVDDLYSPRLRTRRQRQLEERRLAQLMPDAAFRQQLQGFFDANPHFAERFPGGILQFAQMVGQLPADVLEDMMLVEAAAGNGNNNAMPGGFDEEEGMEDDRAGFAFAEVNFNPAPPVPGNVAHHMPANIDQERHEDLNEEQGEEAAEDEDEDEDEEEYSPMPRVIRNILGRLWGRNQPEESSSEDEAPLDDTGVD